MRKIGFLLTVLIFFAALSTAHRSAADSKLAVDESGIRLLLTGKSPLLEMPLVNPTGKPVEAVLELEIVLQNDYEVFKTEKKLTLAPGRATVSIPVDLKTDFKGDDLALFLRNRLRFRLGPVISSADVSGKLIEFEKRKPDAEGIVGFTEIRTDAFQLGLVSKMNVFPGMRLPVRAQVMSLTGDRPVAGVPCEFRMTFPGLSDAPTLTANVVSGPDGEAATVFNLPPNLDDSGPEIEVVARRGAFRRVVSDQLHYSPFTPLLLFLDKPFYQPGQTVHVRLLAFDEFRRAYVGEKLQVEISRRGDNDTPFKTTLTTSRFGVAVCDWPIPESAETGDYVVSASFEKEGRTASGQESIIRISRYELPEFVVTATPDRGFYAPDQNAGVTIRADYLFGKPVGGGNVRIVRAEDRYWDNEARQNIDIPEATVTGVADASGKFSTTFDLSPFRRKFSGDLRFADVTYTAFVTDPTTGRTESRRFDIRISPQPVHVYLSGLYEPVGFPFKIPIRTFTADGAPVACDVTVAGLPFEEIGDEKNRTVIAHRILERGKRVEIRTNRFGVALVDASALFGGPEETGFQVAVRARDGEGRTGFDEGRFQLDKDIKGLSVGTDRNVYRPGWPMTIDVTAAATVPPNQIALVEVMKDNRIVFSGRIRLDGRRGRLVVSNTANFGGPMWVSVGCPFVHVTSSWYQPIASRMVYFQQPDGAFRVETAPDREAYQPGTPASVGLRVVGGVPTQSILGVSIVDRALLERVRTESDEPDQYPDRQVNWFFLNDSFPTDIEGVTADVLERLDLSKPVPPDLDTAAGFLFQNRSGALWSIAGDSNESDPAHDFIEPIGKALMPTLVALEKMSALPGGLMYPRDEATVRQKLAEAGIVFDDVRDPWGTPFKIRHDIEREKEKLNFLSAGPDKRFGTDDDFTAKTRSRDYFHQLSVDIDLADWRFRRSTGKFIRDLDTLKTALRAEGIDFDALRDPWGRPYRVKFDVEELSYVYSFESENPSGERFTLHTVRTPYLGPELKAVRDAIETDFVETNVFPQDEATLRSVLKKKGIELDAIRDGWGRPLYATFHLGSVYSDLIVWKGRKTGEALTVTPVTRRLATIELRSLGPDGVAGNYDDFKAFDCSRILLETNASGEKRNPRVILPAEGKCGLFGIARDATGAVIANADVEILDTETRAKITGHTNGDGVFEFRNLPPGNYQVHFSASGFRSLLFTEVILKDGEVAELNAELSAGGNSDEVVEVSGGPPPETKKVKGGATAEAATVGRRPAATPRVRKYFPETLLWQPEIMTDARGRATVKFRMADSLTTWRMAVVATTTDGRIATTERDLKVFQPFFADVDPPPVLTKGDEISLPVVTRNYLNTAQPATVTLSPAPWFSPLDGTARTVEVKPNEAGMAVFPLRATAPIQDGALSVTVRGADEGDAVEKPVSVHPDGAERFATVGRIVGADGALELDIPATALPDALRTELKFYPNLSAHVLEGIEGILQRPHGCGEQTISSAYVNVLALQMLKKRGMLDSPVALRALENTREGIARLNMFQQWTGGFTYWGGVSEPDAALTAYALRFLKEAKEFAPVEDDLVVSARRWLIKQQGTDGRWPGRDYVSVGLNSVNPSRPVSTMKTAWVACSLAGATDADSVDSLKRALAFLGPQVAAMNEPYAIALFALAAHGSGDTATARDAVKRLRGLAKTEGDTVYWALETNTPFYGWGLAGRIETTALVIAALRTVEGADPVADKLVNRGLSFLLKNKDGYGVWYSTQTTVAVLKAMSALVASESDTARTARVFVDDQPAGTLAIPGGKTAPGPLTLDLSKLIGPGKHRVAIRQEGTAGFASAQAVTRYFLPWSDVPKDDRTPLKLNVAFDRTELAVGEAVRCTVGVERVGHRGYGMLIAEVGLPPGVEVDRASLARALTRPGVWRADVMPDRVVFYLWSNAGGTEVDFSFTPRMAMRAKAAASTLYDYYNPEAATTVAPVLFVVGARASSAQ